MSLTKAVSKTLISANKFHHKTHQNKKKKNTEKVFQSCRNCGLIGIALHVGLDDRFWIKQKRTKTFWQEKCLRKTTVSKFINQINKDVNCYRELRADLIKGWKRGEAKSKIKSEWPNTFRFVSEVMKQLQKPSPHNKVGLNPVPSFMNLHQF